MTVELSLFVVVGFQVASRKCVVSTIGARYGSLVEVLDVDTALNDSDAIRCIDDATTLETTGLSRVAFTSTDVNTSLSEAASDNEENAGNHSFLFSFFSAFFSFLSFFSFFLAFFSSFFFLAI